jgi:hypothetical protein
VNSVLQDELNELLSLVNVPTRRCGDFGWILRNILVNNENNEITQRIIHICKLLRKAEL